MSFRRTIRLVTLFLPVLGFFIIAASPRYAGRLSLLLNGVPFAHVTKADVFKYVKTDDMRNAGIVVSEGHAVGWIYQPMFGFARFVRFTGTPSLEDVGEFDMWFDYWMVIAWSWRWWFLAAEAVVLILSYELWMKRVQSSGP